MDTSSIPTVPPAQEAESAAVPPPLPKREVLLERVAEGAAVPPPLPKATSKAPLGDPTWWRLNRGIPFIVLLLVAAASDYFCPLLCEHEPFIGFGTALGTLFFIAALLLLRKDYSRGEQVFLICFALISAAAQAVSGSILCWVATPAVCLLMLLFPKESEEPMPTGRTWWSFWLARRPDASKAKAVTSGCLPLGISFAAGLVLFFGFLAIFASGNPVVKMAWELICEYWNKFLEFLHLDMTIWLHALTWFIGLTGFGVFTFARSHTAPAAPRPAETPGKSILPHLPSFALTGINAAFAIATSTDIVYLWFRRIPEGISQTQYLHHGAQSIIVASVLAAGLLLLLFRNRGAARQSSVALLLGYLLVFQTALLAVSVFMRLFFQIEAYGFTGIRVLAGEMMLCGVVGIGLLLSYLRGGQFLRHLRMGFALIVLLLFAFRIQPPSALAGDLNRIHVAFYPQWKFETTDFMAPDASFDSAGCLSFADAYMKPTTNWEMRSLRDAAQSVRRRHLGNWRDLTVNALRFRETADSVYERENKKILDLEAIRRAEEKARQEAEQAEQGGEPQPDNGEDGESAAQAEG